MNSKETYESLEMEIILFDTEDVIVTSTTTPDPVVGPFVPANP